MSGKAELQNKDVVYKWNTNEGHLILFLEGHSTSNLILRRTLYSLQTTIKDINLTYKDVTRL
jgi:hypothetical protein